MTGVFHRLGEYLKKMLSSTTSAKVQKTQVANAVELARDAISSVVTYLGPNATATLDKIAVAIHRNGFTTPLDREIIGLYEKRFKHRLPTKYQGMEGKSFLSALIFAIDSQMKADVALIERNFNKVFADLDVRDDIRVSHGYLFGYLRLTEMSVDLFGTLIYLLNIEKTERPPGYHKATLEANVDAVASFVTYLLTRSSGETIMTDLEKIKKGGNVFLMSDGRTIDSYASENDYRPMVPHVLANGLQLNPILLVADMVIAVQRLRHERRVKHREWMATKIAMINMQLSGIDANDPEYKRLEQVLTNYTAMLADLDKKISQYEKS